MVNKTVDMTLLSMTLKYNMKTDLFEISGNVADEKITEVMQEWLRGQLGLGKDDNEPNDKEIYTIIINLNLEDDTFTIQSDTGNASLTCGIVAHFLEKRCE